ncbi:MAG: hypothetical protein GEEBNDBF_02250 [bacterium]|nr:hypothetical protein [bacterium]
MSLNLALPAQDLLEAALRRCLLQFPEWQHPGLPLDPDATESCRDLELTVTRSFAPADLDTILADEVRLHGLTLWALYALLSKPYIIQFQSPGVRWRAAQLPLVTMASRHEDRVELVWHWVVQFCAPTDTDNIYLNRMAPADLQLTLF